MEFSTYGYPPQPGLYYCLNDNKVRAQFYLTGAWVNDAYRTVTFNEPQIVSKEIYECFNDNAAVFHFSIEGTVYYAESGMTWAEWVESEYNTDGFICTDYSHVSYCVALDDEHIIYLNGFVNRFDAILANAVYNFEVDRNGGGSND